MECLEQISDFAKYTVGFKRVTLYTTIFVILEALGFLVLTTIMIINDSSMDTQAVNASNMWPVFVVAVLFFCVTSVIGVCLFVAFLMVDSMEE